MKAYALVTALALLFPIVSFGEVDPFEAAPDPPRPERVIERLPKSISHREIEDGQHEYVISGIYATSPKHDIEDPGALLGEPLIPDCLTCTFDFKKLTCTFTTSRKLTYSELAYALDDIAELGGDMPYWVELEARDIMPSELAGRLEYTTSTVTIDAPTGLAWFWAPDDKPLRIPLSYGGPNLGTLLIVPSTAHCMAHSRYVLRVLDGNGLLVWTDEKTLFAGVKIALSDIDKDSMHEIWIYRDDHGKEERFQITGAFKK